MLLRRSSVEARRKFKLSRRELYDLYWNQNYSQTDIANMFGVNHGTVLHRMRKYGIPTRVGKAAYTKNVRQKMSTLRKNMMEKPIVRKRLEQYWSRNIKQVEGKFGKKIREILYELYWVQEKSISEIGLLLGFNQATIHRWMKKFGVKRRKTTQHSPQCLKFMYKPDLSSSPVLSYTLGVILGDGYVCDRIDEKRVKLGVTSKKFAQSFQKALKKLGMNPGLYVRKKEKGKNVFVVQASCAFFVKWYENVNIEAIENIVSKDHKCKKAFLRGFYESEGTLYIYGAEDSCLALSMSNTKRELILLVQRTLHSLGFKTSLHKRRRKNPRWKLLYELTLLGGTREAQRFLKETKPCIRNSKVKGPKVKRWTEKEVKFLKKHYGKMRAVEIAEELDRSSRGVWLKAYKLGLRKHG